MSDINKKLLEMIEEIMRLNQEQKEIIDRLGEN